MTKLQGLRALTFYSDIMWKKVLISTLFVVLVVSMFSIQPVDAVDGQDSTVYCYGDHPVLIPHSGYNPDTEWTITSENGDEVDYEVDESTGAVTVDISNHDVVHVTQTVDGEVARSTLIALHLPQDESDDDGRYTISFHDREDVIHSYIIDAGTVVTDGEMFVITPQDPQRDGYEFGGWYTDRSFAVNSEFDPRQPVTGDMDVYAKWTSVSTPGGDSGRVDMENHVVTFQCDTGLTYNLLTNTGGIITFEVLEESGYDVVWSTVEVTADYCDVSYLNGVYTLSGINSDVIVQITGEVVTSDNPNAPSDNGGTDYTLYAILLIILAVICIALAVYIMRTRGSRV